MYRISAQRWEKKANQLQVATSSQDWGYSGAFCGTKDLGGSLAVPSIFRVPESRRFWVEMGCLRAGRQDVICCEGGRFLVRTWVCRRDTTVTEQSLARCSSQDNPTLPWKLTPQGERRRQYWCGYSRGRPSCTNTDWRRGALGE